MAENSRGQGNRDLNQNQRGLGSTPGNRGRSNQSGMSEQNQNISDVRQRGSQSDSQSGMERSIGRGSGSRGNRGNR